MLEEKELATKIINRIRTKTGWKPNHCIMEFGEINVGYYDTKEKDDYFVLKYDGIEFTSHHCHTDDYVIQFGKGHRQSTFNLMGWLGELDGITAPKPTTVVIDGVEYQPKG